jgi:hypothetical protein
MHQSSSFPWRRGACLAVLVDASPSEQTVAMLVAVALIASVAGACVAVLVADTVRVPAACGVCVCWLKDPPVLF